MNEDIIILKEISGLAESLCKNKNASPGQLNTLITQYNIFAKKTQNFPQVIAYNENTDSDGYGVSICGDGFFKLILIRIYTGAYLKVVEEKLSHIFATTQILSQIAGELSNDVNVSPYALKALIVEYNNIAKQTNDLSPITPFNLNTDSNMFETCISVDGMEKITTIKIKLSIYQKKFESAHEQPKMKDEPKPQSISSAPISVVGDKNTIILGPSNKIDHSIHTDKKDKSSSKNYFWTKIGAIAAIAGVIVAIIIAVLQHVDTDKNYELNAPISNQEIHSDQHQQIVNNIIGNNNTINNSNSTQLENKYIPKASVDTSLSTSLSNSFVNELCLLYKRAKSIKPEEFRTAGLLTALMDDFNSFARKYNIKEIDSCEKIDQGFDSVNKCGIDRLEKIKYQLNVLKLNHKINCNL